MNRQSVELIPIIENCTIQGRVQPLCDARDLHAFLDVRWDFTTWIKRQIAKYGFVEGVDYEVFHNPVENPQGGRPTDEYHVTIGMAKELAMVERTAKGKEARLYFIECERITLEGKSRQLPSAEDLPVIDQGLRIDQPISLLIPPQAAITCVMPDRRVYTFVWPDKTSNHKVVVGAPRVLEDFINGRQLPMPRPVLFATPLWFDLLGRGAMAITGDTYRADGSFPHVMFPAAQGLIIGDDEEIIDLCNDKGYSINSYLVPLTERRVAP
ncbi:antA/AntB antirepressor family protein [Acidithiobacillus ferrooxidans]|uniref:antA/AntB antirepressor family protein n=1 Tax=Acidithiobacillus ferrooxidans TaxID=920 RepID=UPI00214AFB94|nr:antA/AntB antirepressor family protein [Acidithiobacillus ferrooxidans]MCR2831019.1 antA/AntB antirepressor family protein [Acidithiobacillus ferrooxidans]